MKNSLVKLSVDLYAPGAVLSPQLYKWITTWNTFHSKRIVHPRQALDAITRNDLDEHVVTMDFCHIRLSSLDGEYQGLMDSEVDFLLTDVPMEEFLENQLAIILQKALLLSPPYRQFRTHTAWLELWEFDDEKAQFLNWYPVRYSDILECIKQKTT